MHTSTLIRQALVAIIFTAITATMSHAGYIKVSLPDGRPAAHVELSITIDGTHVFEFQADDNGSFLFPTNDFKTATVSLKSSAGTAYLPVALSPEIIMAGDLSLVIQPISK